LRRCSARLLGFQFQTPDFVDLQKKKVYPFQEITFSDLLKKLLKL
tara:strand:+ start:275 stop:409 length:135 start_codon:yes stop_codon:yes gene_type:complete